MPQLTLAYPKGKGVPGQGERGSWDEGEPMERNGHKRSSNQTAAIHQHQTPFTSWSQTLKTLRSWKGWSCLAPVGVVWSVCQLEAPLHPSMLLWEVCLRLLSVWLPWVILGACVYALKCRLRPGHRQVERSPSSVQQEVTVTENKNNCYSWTSQWRSVVHADPLALALADSLLLCVLQEPMTEPSVTHIKTLHSRLESVSQSLEKADVDDEQTHEEMDSRSALTDKVKLIRTYLQQRLISLCRLAQVQGQLESSVRGLLEGLSGLWAQLEELHTGVTLTKEESRGPADLLSAQTHAQTLFSVLVDYESRLESCQDHLKESTQLLQELTWSHTHTSNTVRSSSQSVWPELLLQSNIEQFDKVQESFLSMEQQTSTFQAHLEGLGKDIHKGHAAAAGTGPFPTQPGPISPHSGPTPTQSGPLSNQSRPTSPQSSLHLHSGRSSVVSLQDRNNSPAPSTQASVSSAEATSDPDSETDAPLSLCEKSARPFLSIGRLRKSARKK